MVDCTGAMIAQEVVQFVNRFGYVVLSLAINNVYMLVGVGFIEPQPMRLPQRCCGESLGCCGCVAGSGA